MRFKLYNTAVCNIYIYYIIKIENIYICQTRQLLFFIRPRAAGGWGKGKERSFSKLTTLQTYIFKHDVRVVCGLEYFLACTHPPGDTLVCTHTWQGTFVSGDTSRTSMRVLASYIPYLVRGVLLLI